MKKILGLIFLAALIGCREPIDAPSAYVEALLGQAMVLTDGEFEYKINYLPQDYFLARLLSAQDASAPSDRKALEKSVRAQYGGGAYFLIRLGLAESSRSAPAARDDLTLAMLQLQSKQEEARLQVTAHLKNGKDVHPELFMVQSDWIAHSGLSVLFCFQGRRLREIDKLELGKNFVISRNQIVAAEELAPKYRLKG